MKQKIKLYTDVKNVGKFLFERDMGHEGLLLGRGDNIVLDGEDFEVHTVIVDYDSNEHKVTIFRKYEFEELPEVDQLKMGYALISKGWQIRWCQEE